MQNHCQPKLPRKLAVALTADVQGYSRLIGQDEDAAHRETMACLDLFRSKAEGFGGRVVRAIGDGALIELQSPTEAVKFAVSMQKVFAERNLELPVERRVEFRIGINLGEVITEKDDIFGDSVNIAARLQTLAYPGGICISQTVYEHIKTKLAFGYEPMGPQELKNILHPVEVYRVRFDTPGLATQQSYREEETQLDLPDLPSVAILPFKNLSGDTGEYYLADGITDDITIALSRFRELFVISRQSAFVYKTRNSPIAEIARELGVRYLVEGSLRRRGTRMRISTQLIEAASGHEVWGEQYDHFFDEVFDVLDELTTTIAVTLALQIQEQERRRVLKAETKDLEAYGLVLRGQELLFLHEQRSNALARRNYERAVELDPEYARGYAAISRTLNYDWRYSWTKGSHELLDRALELADQAVRLDSYDARGFSEVGFVQLYRKEHDASTAAYDRARMLNPNDADLLAEMGDALASCGRPQEAVELLNKAMRLNPYYPDWYLWNLGGAYYQVHDYEKAIATVRKMHNPTEGRRVLAASYAQLGQMEEARKQASAVLQAHPQFSLEHWAEVQPDKDPGDVEHLIEGLRKAGLK
jgi:TolB-like protein/cytochrome c-type biogenesis protein CcmH/NrfG